MSNTYKVVQHSQSSGNKRTMTRMESGSIFVLLLQKSFLIWSEQGLSTKLSHSLDLQMISRFRLSWMVIW